MPPLWIGLALAADITVTTTDDTTADDGLCSLREAVVAANTDTASGATAGECGAGGLADTITVPAGTYTLDVGELDLDAPMSIVGAGSDATIVDAQDLSRCINASRAGDLTIEGLTCRNGNATGVGGGIALDDVLSGDGQGAELTLRDLVVEDCTATNHGGGLRVRGFAATTLEDVTVQRNHSDGDGGGFSLDDDAIDNVETYTMTGVRVLDNDADGDGGGWFAGFGPYPIEFEDWVIAGNSAGGDGGGMYWPDLGGRDFKFLRFSFVNNTAGGYGGALSGRNGDFTFSNTLFTGNHADIGGVLYADGAQMDWDHITAVGNTATTLAAGFYLEDFAGVQMRNSIFTDNSDGGSYAESCGALAYYWYYGSAYASRGGNVVPSTGWNCEVDATDVVADDPDLGTLTVDADGQYVYETNLTSPARGLSDCTDFDGAAQTVDRLDDARPSTDCTAGAFQAEICGDGAITGDEECDDGDTDDDDGCSSVCAVEDDYVCSGTPSDCVVGDDSDGDGWVDEVEALCGTDPLDDTSIPVDEDIDGVCDLLDEDRDGDGWDNGVEDLCGTDDNDVGDVPADNDGDGVCDDLDGDDDDDGWADDLELLCGTDETDDTSVPTDTDSDDVCDVLDDDADGDGVHALTEAACGSDDLDAADVPVDSDSDGACDALDPCPDDVLDDSDSDGTCDSVDLCTGDDTTGDADGDGTCADGDCDDDDDTRYPGAMDACDGVDSDCDGSDEVDGDNDGALSCIDCDDDDDTRYPGAFEADGDGIDSNCDGFERCFTDEDDDGARTTTVVISTDTTCATAGLALADAPYDCDDDDDTLEQLDLDLDGWSTCAGDCDDDDDTLVSCDDLHLSDASLPVASQATEFTLFGADPLAEVVLVRGRLGEVTSLTKCAMDIPLGDAVIARRWDADAAGEAVIPKQMPPNPGLNGYMAVDPVACTVSNVITQQVHDDGL